MLKVIDYGEVWGCENMDLLAPIDWTGYKVLFNNGESKLIDDLDEIKDYPRATGEEYKDFYRARNFIFIGDEVEIVKGRKIPVGEHKIVEKFFVYNVNGTYGHRRVKYVVFTDGTKTDIWNIRNVKNTSKEMPKEFNGGYCLSGRL